MDNRINRLFNHLPFRKTKKSTVHEKEISSKVVILSQSIATRNNTDQKQPSRRVLRKRCSENMLQIYRRHLCRSAISIKLQSSFIEITPCNFIEITLRHGCSSVNLLHIFRTHFLKNTSGWLLLPGAICKIC